MATVRVLLADNSKEFLAGLFAWLSREPNVEVVGSVRSGFEAIEFVDRMHPDLLVMGVSMPSMNGFEATRRIKSRLPAPTIILTTFHDSEAAQHEAWASGADALISKTDVTARLKALVLDLVASRAPRRSQRAPSQRKARSRLSTKQVPPGDVSQ